MKNIWICFIICCLVAGMCLSSTGCNSDKTGKTPPPPVPPVPPRYETPAERHDKYIADNNFMDAEQSRAWLRENHYHVQKLDEGGYRITRDYRDPDTNVHHKDNIKLLGKRAIVNNSGVMMTRDSENNIRVRVRSDN